MSQEQLRTFARDFLTPWMKERGFVRKKLTWNRRIDHFTDVIDLQESRWNQTPVCKFAINIGIFDPEVYELCWGKSAPASVSETDCVVRLRLSSLRQMNLPAKKRTDEWWEIRSETNTRSLSESITRDIDVYALPFFLSHHNEAFLLDYLRNDDSQEC
jgi:Domain of unknown function (DUF4304)